MADTEFFPIRPRRYLAGLVISIVFVAAAVMFYMQRGIYGSYGIIYALLMGGFGLLLLFLNLLGILNKRSGLYLDDEKLLIKSTLVKIAVDWRDIKSFSCFDRGRMSFIGVELFDNDKFIEKQGFLTRRLGKMGIRRSGTPVNIVTTMYDVSRNSLLGELNFRLEKRAPAK